MFSQVFVCPQGTYLVGGMHRQQACVAGGMHGMGCAWQGGVHGSGACMAGGVCVTGGHAWQGVYVEGGKTWHGVYEGETVRILLECIFFLPAYSPLFIFSMLQLRFLVG